jgi:hypothetical protein
MKSAVFQTTERVARPEFTDPSELSVRRAASSGRTVEKHRAEPTGSRLISKPLCFGTSWRSAEIRVSGVAHPLSRRNQVWLVGADVPHHLPDSAPGITITTVNSGNKGR